MIDLTNMDTNDLYWAVEMVSPTPKWKRVQANDESLDDLTLMVKTVISHKQKPL